MTLTPPTDEELAAYFDAHRDRYQQPALYTFTQVFIDPDKRGDATLVDAEAIKASLIARGDAIENAGALGDDFMLQSYYPEKDPLEIRKLFGSGFADSLVELSPGQWHGPVLSGYGTHVVYVSSIRESPPPIYSEVRERVVEEWTTERSEELNEQFYANLRESYTIVIESPAVAEEVVAVQGEAQ